jgi:hypothetical protein
VPTDPLETAEKLLVTLYHVPFHYLTAQSFFPNKLDNLRWFYSVGTTVEATITSQAVPDLRVAEQLIQQSIIGHPYDFSRAKAVAGNVNRAFVVTTAASPTKVAVGLRSCLD